MNAYQILGCYVWFSVHFYVFVNLYKLLQLSKTKKAHFREPKFFNSKLFHFLNPYNLTFSNYRNSKDFWSYADQNKIELEAAFYSRRHHTLVAKANVSMEAFEYQKNTSSLIPINIQRRVSQLDEIQIEESGTQEKFDPNAAIPEFSDEEIASEWLGELPKT
mgnify:CR=1 FL=1